MSLLDSLVSQGVSGGAFEGRGFFGGRRGHMAAAWSMWLERRVVNCEARVFRSSVEAVEGGVLRMAVCKEAVWLMRSGVLCWYACMRCCVRGSVNVYLRVECGLWDSVSDEGGLAMREKGVEITR
jgi:hypothetical protein